MQFFTLNCIAVIWLHAIGTQRGFEAEVAIPQLIDKGKQFWWGEHERPLFNKFLAMRWLSQKHWKGLKSKPFSPIFITNTAHATNVNMLFETGVGAILEHAPFNAGSSNMSWKTGQFQRYERWSDFCKLKVTLQHHSLRTLHGKYFNDFEKKSQQWWSVI